MQGVYCDTVCRYYELMKECWQYKECWEYRECIVMYCVQILRADEGVLAVQAVQATHLRHNPSKTCSAILWQQTERRLLLRHQPAQ